MLPSSSKMMSRSASSLACRALLLPSPSSSSSPLLRRSMAKAAASATDAPPDEAAAAAKTQPKRSLIRAKTPSLYDDFEYDETTNIGHEMVQKEREALAFMRTVELELPKLKPIPFEKPNLETHYIRYHTQKTWPTEHDSKDSVPVTLSCPISRLPLRTPAAKHKFLLLTTPDYHHPLRPVAFSRRDEYLARNPMKPGPYNRKHSRGVESPPVHSSSYKDDTYNVQAPRVGGWTPEEAREVEWDKELRKGINERGEGEGKDGWFVIKSDLFPYQLQNKKWCEDTLRRLVVEANDETDPMTDIPLDMTPYTNTYMKERRRPDGTLPSIKEWPSAWATPTTPSSTSSSPSSSSPDSLSAPPPKELSEFVDSLQEELDESPEVTPLDVSVEEMENVKQELDEEPVVRSTGAEPMLDVDVGVSNEKPVEREDAPEQQ